MDYTLINHILDQLYDRGIDLTQRLSQMPGQLRDIAAKAEEQINRDVKRGNLTAEEATELYRRRIARTLEQWASVPVDRALSEQRNHDTRLKYGAQHHIPPQIIGVLDLMRITGQISKADLNRTTARLYLAYGMSTATRLTGWSEDELLDLVQPDRHKHAEAVEAKTKLLGELAEAINGLVNQLDAPAWEGAKPVCRV